MRSEWFWNLARPPMATVLCVAILLVSVPTSSFAQENSNQNQAILEASARAFVEAEVKNYVERFVNSHPPIEGVQGFGSKALFAAQLLLAANDYLHADSDKKRFRAVEQGAAAYVAYAYAATPAVGLAVTAVVLVSQIIEGAVASSYEEAMLAIYKDMQETQLRINDLKMRLGMGEALRFMAFVDETQRTIGRTVAIDKQIAADCGAPASTFDALGTCLTELIQAVTTREEAVAAIDRLLSCPDSMLGMLPLAQGNGNPNDNAAASRNRLVDIRKQTATQLAALQKVYDQFVKDFQRLAVSVISEEALGDVQRQELVNEIKHQCLADDTTLSSSAATLVYQITSERQELAKKKPAAAAAKIGASASALLESYEQRRIACPSIASDAELSQLMKLVRSRVKQLPRP
jgi:hypothetical protein